MKRTKKFISMLMAMLMLFSLLPAQFALATGMDDMENYITYANTMRDVPSGYQGNVWELTATPENEYSDYKLTIYAHNVQGLVFVTSMRYNTEEVAIVYAEDGTEFVRGGSDGFTKTDIADFGERGKLVAEMTSDTNLTGKSIIDTDSAFEVGEEMVQTLSEVNNGGSDDEFYYLSQSYTIKELGTMPRRKWTVAATGAKYQAGEKGTYNYTTPTDVACPLISYYFKVKDGKKLTDTSIYPNYDHNTIHGGGGQIPDVEGKTVNTAEGVCLVGFPKAEVPDQTVNFSVYEADGTTAVNLAAIKVYNNASMEASALVTTLETNGEGKATATLPANTTYFYSVEKEGYVTSAYPEDSTNTVAVGAAETNAPIVKLTKESDVEYSVTIKITDADAKKGEEVPVEGATVTIDNVSGATLTTNASGEVTTDLKAGKHVVNAEKRGEFEARETAYEFTVVKDSNPTVVVPITPERAEITLPTVKDANGEIVTDATIVVEKISQNSTSAWGTSVTYYSSDFGKTIKVPKNTKFVVKVSAPNYTDNTLYLQSDSSAGTYYSDTECNNTVEGTDVSIARLDAPIYKVEVTQDETDTSLFTAEVTLSNVNTENGAFGLRYDKNLFSLDSFTLKSEDQIELFSLAEDATMKENLGPITQSTGSDSIGYHVFTWRAKWGAISSDGSPADIGNGTFNTMTGAKPVATYQFRLNVGKSANDIRQDSFTVMPYDKTQHGSTIADYWTEIGDSYTEAYTNFLSRAWRYTDDKNKGDKETLEEGRLPEENTVINGVDTKGFYQVYSENTDLDITVSYDVRTVIEYKNFDAKKAGVSFIVTDEKNAPIKDAEVKLYDSEGNALAIIKTDLTGIADYPVDTSISDVTIKYVVSRNGYWDYPETDLNSVTINRTIPPTSINEYVKMKEKIYHNPILKYADETEVETTKATLSGDKYAYNEKDFHFNVKPAAGMKFNPPATLQLVVEGVKHTANYVKSENVYVVEGQYIIGEATGEADENGFPSNDVIVLIPSSSLVESDDKYTVTALAGTNGTVSYEAGEDGAAKDDANSDTSKIIIPDIQPNGKTGTITFKAADTYMVEKVFVNGVQIHDYDGKTTFDYSFDKITMDNTIVVTFWDGFTPSTDSIITLIVGDKGTANVTAPETAAVSNTRKVFLKPSASLTFTATPVDGSYLLNAVKKQVDDGALEDVAPAGDTYTVDAVAGKNVTVYVTFKDKDAEDTFNVFVTSYVASGEGTINPVGVLIYNKYDSPSFVLTAATADWQASGVMIDDTEVTFGRNSTYTYTLTSVEKDTSIGAIFAETAYVVSGIIDYSQNTTIADGRAVTSAATVTFTRDDDGTVVVSKDVGTNRTNATFTADLAPGTWTVKISKAGYLDYIITGFKMEKNPDGMKFGAAAQGEGATPKKIVLTVGDVTGRGKAVSLTDAGVIANGLRTGATDKIKARADIDDDGRLQVGDMAYIMKNYGMRYTKQSYDDFVAQP